MNLKCGLVRTSGQIRNKVDDLKKAYKRERKTLESTGAEDTSWKFYPFLHELLHDSVRRNRANNPAAVDNGRSLFDAVEEDQLEEEEEPNDGSLGRMDSGPLKQRRKLLGKSDAASNGSSDGIAKALAGFVSIYSAIESSKQAQTIEFQKYLANLEEARWQMQQTERQKEADIELKKEEAALKRLEMELAYKREAESRRLDLDMLTMKVKSQELALELEKIKRNQGEG